MGLLARYLSSPKHSIVYLPLDSEPGAWAKIFISSLYFMRVNAHEYFYTKVLSRENSLVITWFKDYYMNGMYIY